MFYHWVPFVRFYLIAKQSYTATDVDAIFKVNSMSSFTLGAFQLIGIIATFVLGKSINLYVKINMASQILNWFITICYFATSIPLRMSVAAQARTLSRHFQGILSEFANESAKTINDVMCTREDDVEAAQSRLRQMKAGLAEVLAQKFLPGVGSPPSSPPPAAESPRSSISTCRLDEAAVAQLVEASVIADTRIVVAKHARVTARNAFLNDMVNMRDIDVKDFLVLLRNQIMSVLDVRGGL